MQRVLGGLWVRPWLQGDSCWQLCTAIMKEDVSWHWRLNFLIEQSAVRLCVSRRVQACVCVHTLVLMCPLVERFSLLCRWSMSWLRERDNSLLTWAWSRRYLSAKHHLCDFISEQILLMCTENVWKCNSTSWHLPLWFDSLCIAFIFPSLCSVLPGVLWAHAEVGHPDWEWAWTDLWYTGLSHSSPSR